MNRHFPAGAHALAISLLIALAVSACSGAATPAGPAGGGDPEPGDFTATLQGAFDKVIAADAFTFEAAYRGYGATAFGATVTGTVRRTPVESSVFNWTSPEGTTSVHLIHDGTLWLDGGDGKLVNVGAPSDSIRDQQSPYEIREIWDSLDFQLDDYEMVGEEQVTGVSTTHYRLNDYRREQAVEMLKIPASQYSADIWIDGEGNLRKVFRGVQADASGEPTKGDAVTWTLTGIGCECPVEAPEA